MTKEIVEAVGVLEREKGISADRLMAALEDALLSAYKKTPGAAQVRARGHGPRQRRLPRVRAAAARRSSRSSCSTRSRRRPGSPPSIPRPGRCASPSRPRSTRSGSMQYRDQIERARRHAGRLRPHRRADRQAGDPPAHPRGRARHDVRRVPGPRRRADHRHRPAVRLALHARAAARARRGAAAASPSRCTASATTTARASRPSSPTSRTRRRARRSSCRGARPS